MSVLLNAVAFLALMAVYIGFRRMMLRRRRASFERFHRTLGGGRAAPPPLPVPLRCPRCAAAWGPAGGFCPRCGLDVRYAAPPPQPPYPPAPASARSILAYLIVGVLGALGLAAFWFVTHGARPAPPALSDPFARPPWHGQ